MQKDSRERLQRYYRLAQFATEQAAAHGRDARFNYLRLAQHWRKLATFSEATDNMAARHNAGGEEALPRRALLFLPLP